MCGTQKPCFSRFWGGRSYVTNCIWNILCNHAPPPKGGNGIFEHFPEVIPDEIWGIFHPHHAPLCPIFATLDSFGKGCYSTPLAERRSTLGSRTLGRDHLSGHVFQPLRRPTSTMPATHLTISNHGKHIKPIKFGVEGRCARACPP